MVLEAVYGGTVPEGACFWSGTGELPSYTRKQYQDMIDAAGRIDRYVGEGTFAGSLEALLEAIGATFIGEDEEVAWLLVVEEDARRAQEWSKDESTDGTSIWTRSGQISLC